MTLEQFALNLNEFDKETAGNKIDYFVYFLTVINGVDGVKSKDIEVCFTELKTTKYSNISQYLSLNSKKTKNKPAKFYYHKGLYHLERTKKAEIDKKINAPRIIAPTNNYFPLELFNNTRGYLVTVATQAAGCYDNSLFDACSVMTRKLLEILIIEAFERFKIEAKIKNPQGNFFFLSELIDTFKSETSWNVGRNAKKSLPNLKKIGDLSAHNRRYIARQTDIDNIREDLRIVLEELIHIIDYPNWK